MPRERLGRIAFATIVPPYVVEDSLARIDMAGELQRSIHRGHQIERYGRTWTMGRIARSGEDYVQGRIGFERPGGINEVWDRKQGDFVGSAISLGSTTAFAIDLPTGRTAFQLRPGVIERQSFAGAMQALLSDASEISWRVVPETDPVGYDEFISTVDRVSKVTIRVNRPNPHYAERQLVEELVEGSTSRYVQMTFAAREGESVNLDEPLMVEAIEHAAADYGYVKVDAERSGHRVRYDSTKDGIAPELSVSLKQDEAEVSPQQVRITLEDRD